MLMASSACGKKGPPLPPIVHAPDALRQVVARRLGGDVFLTLTLPTQNVDGSVPVDLGRVEVYGYTGRFPPPATRFTEVATLVGTVAPPPEAGPSVSLRDTLTPDELVDGPPLARAPGSGSALPDAVVVDVSTRGPLKRFYLVVAFSDRNRPGPPSAVVEVPLTPVPDPPIDVRAGYNAQAAMLTWEPSGGLVGFLLDRAAPPPASPLDDGPGPEDGGAMPAGPTRYNVYRETAPDPLTPPPPVAATSAGAAPPPALNQMPLEVFVFTDPLQVDGRKRCYTVTAVRGTGERAAEGSPSVPACITPVDTFPPAPPTGVSPIATDGSISLVWEANTERDLRGYVVLRGEAGAATLTPVTGQVISETRFTDSDVRPGVEYVYAVTAVDSRLPQPNVSAESERVEITAR